MKAYDSLARRTNFVKDREESAPLDRKQFFSGNVRNGSGVTIPTPLICRIATMLDLRVALAWMGAAQCVARERGPRAAPYPFLRALQPDVVRSIGREGKG